MMAGTAVLIISDWRIRPGGGEKPHKTQQIIHIDIKHSGNLFLIRFGHLKLKSLGTHQHDRVDGL